MTPDSMGSSNAFSTPMQYFDRNTDPERFPDDVGELIRGMLYNRQLFNDEQDDPPFVTSALKYDSQPQQRRQTSAYTGSDPFVESIIDIFGFDPLDFQVESWQTVDRLDRRRLEDSRSKAAVFSAPTGFGKTEAFLGPLYQLQLDNRQEGAAIVYPSRALLQDQLGRVLEHIHDINDTHDESLSVGLYMGGQPWEMSQVEGSDFFGGSRGLSRFKLANCWCSEEGDAHSFEYHGTSQGYVLECEHDDSHRFSDREVVLPRKDLVFNNQPDILLTTLESLEGFAHKPHYPLIEQIDTIVLDEVHLYTQLRGAHAAKIIENVTEISDDPLLWLGSSATIDNPERFGKRIFGIDNDSDIEALRPPESDFDESHDDVEHYYFLLSPEEGPGVSSMAIQQYMLLGHSLLQDPTGERGKLLSFIDSISQVNQKSVQFTNADRDRRLWQYHTGGDEVENWPAVAQSRNCEFVDEPLDVMKVYSDEGFDSDTAADSDLLLSTSFLEVGIDVGEIRIISQYRTPWDLSSFLQRAGRAAREPGMDSHVTVFLSNLTDDANMFYRAGRFLGSNIRTPLKTDNPVVEWIHNQFHHYYQRAVEIDENQHQYRSAYEEHQVFLKNYLGTDLGYQSALELILEPPAFAEDYFDGTLDLPDDPLLSEAVIEEAEEALQAHLDELHEDFQDIESYFGMEDGDVVRGTGAVDTYVLEVQTRVLDLVNSFRGQVTGYSNRLHANDVRKHDSLVNSITEQLIETHEAASSLPDGDPAAKISHFSEVVAELFTQTGDLMRLRSAANRVSDGPVPSVNTDRLNAVHNAVDQLDALGEDERLQTFYRRQKEIYYLKQALGELADYCDSMGKPYFSLYSVKNLLRYVYYVDRYLRASNQAPDSEVWFVPPDYYGSSGQFMTVFYGETDQSGSQESIDQIVSSYTPYRSEYQSDAGTMQAFLPMTEVVDGEVRFDFDSHVTGEERDGILIPDSIRMSEITDLADEQAQNIVRYCPVCLQIISDLDQCLRHNQSELGKIHSDAQVDTTVTDREVDGQLGSLSIANVSAETTLEGVKLEITPADYMGPEIGYAFTSGEDRQQREITSPDTPLGFQLDTRGLVIDMSDFWTSLGDEVRDRVALYNDLDEVSFEYLTYHTAAHFFLQLTADISSVNTTNLLYGFDESAEEVYVFERTEGGQGVVDLVYEEFQTDPASVLEVLNRIAYNPQVINERLWSMDEFADDLPTDARTEADLRSVVEQHLPVPFESVTSQVVQEVLSTVDRCRQFAADTGREIEDTYAIKQAVAHEQIRGAEDFPAAAAEQAGARDDDLGRVKTLFYSPDIDSCVENLQLTECIASGDQGDSLSYVLVEALRNHLTHTVATDEAADTMFDYEHPPAAEINGTSIFLDI